jgi:hypothetical protein
LVLGHDHNDVLERFPSNHAVDRVMAVVEHMAAFMAQDEVVAVVVNGSAELVQVCHPVHLQGGLVGIGDGLVRLDQDHTLGQAGNDLLQLRAVRGLMSCTVVRFVMNPIRGTGGSRGSRAPIIAAACA